MSDEPCTVHLLWTGGWDSTYRLLHLLWAGAVIQPHYIIDSGRPSSSYELQAMEAIRTSIAQRASDLPGQLLVTEVSSNASSVHSVEIRQAYIEILKRMYIGEQYMWLADYCHSRRIECMEIGVEQNPIILQAVNSSGYPFNEIFGKFRFPILSISKVEMGEWAEETGLLSILEQSWFCHTPTKSGAPCGTCHPCEVTIRGGVGYRLPPVSRMRYHLRVLPRLKALAKAFPKFYYLVYRLKHKN